MRSLAYIQNLLNDNTANLAEYAERSATGGTLGATNVGTEGGKIIHDVRKSEQVIVLGKDTTLQSLGTPDAGQTMLAFSSFLVDIFPTLAGGDKAMLGQYNIDTPSASLFQQSQKQTRVSLKHFSDKLNDFLIDCGTSFCELTAHMVNEFGELQIPNFLPQKGEESSYYINSKNLVRNYVTYLEKKEISQDEQHEEFVKMMELVQNSLTPEQKAKIFPDIIRAAPLSDEIKDSMMEKLNQQMTPEQQQMQQQQQQLQMEQVTSQIRLTNAQSFALEETAKRENAGASLSNQKAVVEIDKTTVQMDKDKAQTTKIEMDTAAVLAKIGMDEYNMVNSIVGARE
jgi:hypothetical protein